MPFSTPNLTSDISTVNTNVSAVSSSVATVLTRLGSGSAGTVAATLDTAAANVLVLKRGLILKTATVDAGFAHTNLTFQATDLGAVDIYSGRYVTVVKADGSNSFTMPVVLYDTATKRITYVGILVSPFVPAAGDLVFAIANTGLI